MIENDLSRIAFFHGKGLRVWQLTHHNNVPFAGGAIEPVQSGLTPLGREGIAEFNRNRILIDVSHGSDTTIRESAGQSTAPIIYSHGACRALLNHPRCISDEGIREIAGKGGVVGTFMMSFWLTRDPVPQPRHLIAHLRHVMKIGGESAMAIANDFPFHGQDNLLKLNNNNAEGVKEYHAWWKAMDALGIPGFSTLPEHVVIPEFNSIHRMERIRRAMEKARFTPRQIELAIGGNLKRILTDVLG
jgi:membrane dipeptidase